MENRPKLARTHGRLRKKLRPQPVSKHLESLFDHCKRVMSVHIEQEIKLQAPRRFDLSVLADGVDGFSASPIQAHKLSTVYYDTDDLRLTRWGCSLRFRRGQGWTLKLPAASENGSLARVEHTFAADGDKTASQGAGARCCILARSTGSASREIADRAEEFAIARCIRRRNCRNR